MCVRIGVEDLAANALIELIKMSDTHRFVSYQDMEAYGLVVARLLKKKGEEVVLVLSRSYTDEVLWYYSDYFEETFNNGEIGISLRDGKTADDLRKQFRGYLGIDVLLAFVDEESVKTLKAA